MISVDVDCFKEVVFKCRVGMRVLKECKIWQFIEYVSGKKRELVGRKAVQI